MGTFNYKRNDFITLAIEPYDRDDLIKDADFREWCNVELEINLDDTEALEAEADEEISSQYEADYAEAERIIDKYSLEYFPMEVKSGYYEGYQIDFDVDFNYYAELEDVLAEIEPLRKMFKELNAIGYHATIPFWCPTYYTKEETDTMIDKAIEEIRAKVEELYAEDEEAI